VRSGERVEHIRLLELSATPAGTYGCRCPKDELGLAGTPATAVPVDPPVALGAMFRPAELRTGDKLQVLRMENLREAVAYQDCGHSSTQT
jgi:hypothetical protein